MYPSVGSDWTGESGCFCHRRWDVTVWHHWTEDVFCSGKQWTSSGQATVQRTSCDSEAENKCCFVSRVKLSMVDRFLPIRQKRASLQKTIRSISSILMHLQTKLFPTMQSIKAVREGWQIWQIWQICGTFRSRVVWPRSYRQERQLSRLPDVISERCHRCGKR